MGHDARADGGDRQARAEDAAHPSEGDAFPPVAHVERPDELRRDGARDDHLVGAHQRDKTGWTPPTIDIGGGWTFGKWYGTGPNNQLDDSNAPTAEDYARLCCAAIKEEAEKHGLPLPKLRLEPGRSLSGPAGVAVGTVGAVKQGDSKKWVNMDLSTNHLSWAAVLDWYYHSVPVVNADARRPRRSTSSARSAIPTRSARTARCRR